MNEDIEEILLALDVDEPTPQWRYLQMGTLNHLVREGSNKALCGLTSNSWKDWLGDKDNSGLLDRHNCSRCSRKEVELT